MTKDTQKEMEVDNSAQTSNTAANGSIEKVTLREIGQLCLKEEHWGILECYIVFWSLSLKDIHIPRSEYDDYVKSVKNASNDPSSASISSDMSSESNSHRSSSDISKRKREIESQIIPIQGELAFLDLNHKHGTFSLPTPLPFLLFPSLPPSSFFLLSPLPSPSLSFSPSFAIFK